MAQAPLHPQDALAALGRIRLDTAGVDDVLNTVADLARRSIPAAAEVSVTLLRDGTAQSVAVTGELALRLDEWQYEQGRGPCLDASVSGDALSVPDTAGEDRWPDWGSRAAEAGVGSSLSIGLPIQEAVVGTLNVYGRAPRSFDGDSIGLAKTFAAYAAAALSNAHLYSDTATLAEQMRAAMETRAVIEQAKGIVMGERRCGPEEAFSLLAKISQDTGHKLRDVAAALVTRATGESR
ncbi:GAF and ANTAR domain-containing protein [Micromonospora sp. CPCC 205556]|uniref:GAF and ANTAR domain-containing protein n=1 Tax=Micromonospora sp. CPCC 205556 TaxID=3122398 RepID=UPI002FF3312A